MTKTFRSLILLVLLALFAAPLFAGTVTVTWDPNTEPDVTGYVVLYGTQSGVYKSSQPVGNITTYTVDNLAAGQTYYFAVQAVSLNGLTSPLSQEVTATIPGAQLTEAEWMAKFGVTDMTADADGDGVTNRDEYTAATDPTLPNTWTLAEGATGFFKARLAITNPGTDTAEITVRFLREGSTEVVQRYTIPALSRKTIVMNDVPGLNGPSATSMSTEITTQRGGVVVERTMTWNGDDQMLSAHTGKAVSKPSTTWYFAEGDVRSFDTYLLLANSQSYDVSVAVDYLIQGGRTVTETYVVEANRRRTIYANNIPAIGPNSFSMTVKASAPVFAERAMYFSTPDFHYKGGHDSPGVEQPSTTWFIAEGHTGPMFAEYILLSNPNYSPATATVRYLTPSGNVSTRTYELQATSRTTILVNDIPGLESTDVSASIDSTLPIVAERSMYWPGTWGQWYEGHNSLGMRNIGTKWALAEGEQGGAHNAISYILLANPTGQEAAVTLTVLRDNGLAPIVVRRTVPANSRQTVNSNQLPLGSAEYFGAIVESTNGVPIAVERSIYWNGAGKTWIAGTNETGALIK